MGATGSRSWWLRATGVLLAIAYGIGAPLAAWAEVRGHALSQKFDLPPAFVLAVCVVQFACAFGVLVPRLASLAAAVLTVTTLGAIGLHLRIGAPAAALPAFVFTGVQVAFGLGMRKPAVKGLERDARVASPVVDQGGSMSKELRCGDLMSGCSAVVEGKDEKEVMARAVEHAKSAHGLDQIPPEMAGKVQSAIHDKEAPRSA